MPPINTSSSTPLPLFSLRSKILFFIEQYFQSLEYIALHTPSMAPYLIPERHIDVFSIDTDPPRYLMPSPEMYLKILLAQIAGESATIPHVYEFSHAFRTSEVHDTIHNEEFLMLEWYTAHASLEESLQLCIDLIVYVVEHLSQHKHYTMPSWAQQLLHGVSGTSATLNTERIALFDRYNSEDACASIRIMSVEEAFSQYVGIDLSRLILCEQVEEAVAYVSQHTPLSLDTHWNDWEELFHFLLVDKVEPKLSHDMLIFLIHYPTRVSSLAQACVDNPLYSDRFELYIQGNEIANCYVEETDSAIIQNFMQQQHTAISKGRGMRTHNVPYPKHFLNDTHFPPYSGVALGVDRLVWCLLSDMTDNNNLSAVSPLAWLQDYHNE